ncbi:MAG: hypothetical protein AABZ74_07785 [Cyanobacteriota bacterium]
MAYTDFSIFDVSKQFNISYKNESLFEFDKIESIEASDWLIESLKKSKLFSLRNEKSKSELIISPIFVEVKEKNMDKISIFSGEHLNIDKKLRLWGECDFIITSEANIPELVAPIIAVVEAKKGEIELGLGQCSAQMVGIKMFNEKHNTSIKKIYGCVTTGKEWKFLKLENNIMIIDNDNYFIDNIPKILGIFKIISNNI